MTDASGSIQATGFSASFVAGVIAADASTALGNAFVGPVDGKGISAVETVGLSADQVGITLAHMLGHNFGLPQVVEPTNLMSAVLQHGLTSDGVTLMSDQIAAAQQSGLLEEASTLQPVPEPATSVLLLLGGALGVGRRVFAARTGPPVSR